MSQRPLRNLYDPALCNIFLQPGEVYVAETPALVSTVLGSCVAVTLHAPRLGLGAICHGMLPSGGSSTHDLRYVEQAIRHIHGRLTALCGGDAMEAKLFGGAEVLTPGRLHDSALSIGSQNITVARQTLEELGLLLSACHTGGARGRKIFFYTGTGEVYLRQVRKTER